MRNLILASAAILTFGFGSSSAMAEHNRSYVAPRCAPRATPYQAYRSSPSYSSRYHGYQSPYYRPVPSHSYHPSHQAYRYPSYGYSSYPRSSIGVYGQNFSFRIGF